MNASSKQFAEETTRIVEEHIENIELFMKRRNRDWYFDIKKTSSDWCNVHGIDVKDILDPDGWDRTNYDYSFYNECIDEYEFERRLILSTCNISKAIRIFYSKLKNKDIQCS